MSAFAANTASTNQKAQIVSISKVMQINDANIVGKVTYSAPSNIAGLGNTSISEALSIEDVVAPLFPTFDDPQAALTKVKSQCKSVINEIANTYSLDELSSSNWDTYYQKMLAHLDDPNKPSWYKIDNPEFAQLFSFFDIYENDDANAGIKSQVKSASSVAQLLADDNFICSLPYWSSYQFRSAIEKKDESLSKEINSIVSARSKNEVSDCKAQLSSCPVAKLLSYNQSNAIWYAKYYAKNYNTNYPYHDGHDCANFASQILNYAGESMNTSWYCTSLHSSAAWDNENSFMNYWTQFGIQTDRFSHKAFTDSLKPGNFISYDANGDGNWDHVGFVTDKARDYNPNLGYTDYQVAQHSGNYLLWTSESGNGWETIPNSYPKNIYGVLQVNA